MVARPGRSAVSGQGLILDAPDETGKKRKHGAKAPEQARRDARLAQALRDNLSKRKAQVRAREAGKSAEEKK